MYLSSFIYESIYGNASNRSVSTGLKFSTEVVLSSYDKAEMFEGDFDEIIKHFRIAFDLRRYCINLLTHFDNASFSPSDSSTILSLYNLSNSKPFYLFVLIGESSSRMHKGSSSHYESPIRTGFCI